MNRILMILLVSFSINFGQDFNFDAKIGGNLDFMFLSSQNNSYQPKLGFTSGISLKYNIDSSFGLRSDLYYTVNKSTLKLECSQNDICDNDLVKDLKSLLDLSILIDYKLSDQIVLSTGTMFRFPLDYNWEYYDAGKFRYSYNPTGEFTENFGYGINIGIKYFVYDNFFFELINHYAIRSLLIEQNSSYQLTFMIADRFF